MSWFAIHRIENVLLCSMFEWVSYTLASRTWGWHLGVRHVAKPLLPLSNFILFYLSQSLQYASQTRFRNVAFSDYYVCALSYLRVGWLLRKNREREGTNYALKSKKGREEKKNKRKTNKHSPKTQGFIFVRCLGIKPFVILL